LLVSATAVSSGLWAAILTEKMLQPLNVHPTKAKFQIIEWTAKRREIWQKHIVLSLFSGHYTTEITSVAHNMPFLSVVKRCKSEICRLWQYDGYWT